MEYGFIRGTRRTSADRQREMLEAYGLPATAIEQDWEYAWKRLRGGDVLVVAALRFLAPDKPETLRRLKMLAQASQAVMLKSLETGRTSDPATLLEWPDMEKGWTTETKCADPKEMARRGRKGGRPSVFKTNEAARKFALAMRKMGKSDAVIQSDLQNMHNVKVSRTTLQRLWADTGY